MSDNAPYPKPYLDFLAEYHGSRDYFECHEIMEAHWKRQSGSRYEGCWLVLIRISVACYHARRGNWAGARKMMAKAAEEIDPIRISELGLDGDELAEMLREVSRGWNEEPPPTYRDLDLPIADPVLRQASEDVCVRKGWTWGAPLESVPPEIVHRHLTRDRTEVVEARRLSAERKRAGREKQI